MAFWVVVALGATCVLAAIFFIYRGIGGHAAGGTVKLPGGAELTLQAAGQAGITLMIGAALLFVGANGLANQPSPAVSRPAGTVSPPSGNVSLQSWSPDQLLKIKVVSYVRTGTDHHGEFRNYGSHWEETFSDITLKPRTWIESTDVSDGLLRLTDTGALIEIDPAKKLVYYGDRSSPLDTITSVEKAD